MKKKLVISLAFFMLLCILAQSCKRFSLYSEKETPPHYTMLQTITDTMTCCPDVALNILINVSDTIDDSHLSKPDYYEYQILIAEALFKNDFLQTNDFAVYEAVNYYDSLAEKYPKNVDALFQKSRAHYYKAVGESEKDNIKNACAEYLISLKTIDEIKKKDRNDRIEYFNGLIYNRLSDIYYYNDAFNVAQHLYIKANESFTKTNSIMPIAINHLCIAKILSAIDLYCDAENHLDTADSLITYVLKNENNQLKRKILLERALLTSYKNDDNKKALELARQYMSMADNEEEVISGYTAMGEIFYKDCQYDSAFYYFEKDFSRNHYTMLHCGNRIIEISNIIGDSEKAAYYAPFLAEETNKELGLAPLKAELVAMYEKYEADRHKAEIKNLLFKIIITLVLLIIAVVTVFYVVSVFRKRRHLKEISRKDWYIGTLHGKIKKTTAENKNAKENIKSLENKLIGLQDAETRELISFSDRIRNIKADELCKKLFAITQMHIKTTVKYPELVLSNDEKMYLTELFDKELKGSLRAIITKHHRLKRSDELLFCLYLLGLDEKHIAAVTGNSYHNVFVRSKKCLKAIGCESDLPAAVANKIKNHLQI